MVYYRINRWANSLLEYRNWGQGRCHECWPPRTNPVSPVQSQVHDASLCLLQHGNYISYLVRERERERERDCKYHCDPVNTEAIKTPSIDPWCSSNQQTMNIFDTFEGYWKYSVLSVEKLHLLDFSSCSYGLQCFLYVITCKCWSLIWSRRVFIDWKFRKTVLWN